MNLVGGTHRMDVPRGLVPDYRTFARHLWSYSDDGLQPVSAPPTMYRILFSEADDDFEQVMNVAERAVEEHVLGDGQLTWLQVAVDGDSLWEFRFGTIEAIHAFCLQLAAACREDGRSTVAHVGEFIMWTLGFRWV